MRLVRIRDDADGVGAGRRHELQAEDAKPARGAPHQHVVAGLERVRRMAEQHAIGRRQGERVAGGFFPGQVRRLCHQLARLHPAELRERAVRRLVAPDALRRRQQRIAAVAILVVAVVLITVHDDFVADLPAPNLGADRPDDARRIGAGDVERMLVSVERRDRNAETGPDAVIVDAAGHHIDQHLVFGDRPGRHDFAAASPARADRGAPCGSPRRAFFQARGRAAGPRRWHRGPSAARLEGFCCATAMTDSVLKGRARLLQCDSGILPQTMLQRNNYLGRGAKAWVQKFRKIAGSADRRRPSP